MRKNITELVFILDRSGSMSGLEIDTIGGFDSLVTKQRMQQGECYITTILFNNESVLLHDRIPLARFGKMMRTDYVPFGGTALADAIGDGINHISTIHRYSRREDLPNHTMFVIMTDGMENASRKYTVDSIKQMIEYKKRLGWEFLFVGANIDAVNTAVNIGISRDRAVDYHADRVGTPVAYSAVSNAVCSMRANAPISPEWAAEVRADYQHRK